MDKIKIEQSEPGIDTLVVEAESILGYGVMRQQLPIAHYPNAEVEAYKSEAIVKAAPNLDVVSMILGVMVPIALAMVVLFFVVMLIITIVTNYDTANSFYMPRIICVSVIVFGISLLLLLLVCPHIPAWDRVPIEKYARPIPEFALQTAIDIKKAYPSVEIYVDELVAKTIDPFLVVISGGWLYYVEKWNEPGFKVKQADIL